MCARDWQPDLFHGAGIQRADVDAGDQLSRARQEMRDTDSADIFDLLAGIGIVDFDTWKDQQHD